MKRNPFIRQKKYFYCFIILVILLSGIQIFGQQDKPKPRDIIPVFETTRPAATNPVRTKNTPVKKKKRKPYKRVAARQNSGRVKTTDRPGKRKSPPNQADIAEKTARQIGVTLWQLNEVRFDRKLETFAFSENGRRRYLHPERVSSDNLFDPYDRVRLTIESSRRGYLYVIDQEMYVDGSIGDAYLVFPNKRINAGANLVTPGKPVELPDLSGNPFYFELRPKNADGQTLGAEILTVIITDRPIDGLEIGTQPILISQRTLTVWEKRWAGRTEIFEADEETAEDAGYTRREHDAAGGKTTLTAEDPLPKSIFMVEANRKTGTLISIPLWYRVEK